MSLNIGALTPLQRSMISAFSGLLGYGGWAYWVNASYGWQASFKAACVQGGYSFLLTFVMTLMIEFFYRFFLKFSRQIWLVNGLAIILTCSIIFSTSWWVNAMAGTPEIFKTVILGYIIGGFYTVAYVFGLSKQMQSNF